MLPLYTVLSNGIQREQDPTQKKVADDVFNRLSKIQQENCKQEKSQQATNAVGIVSVEQALKELKDLGAI